MLGESENTLHQSEDANPTQSTQGMKEKMKIVENPPKKKQQIMPIRMH